MGYTQVFDPKIKLSLITVYLHYKMLKKIFLILLLLNAFITNAQESVSIGLAGEYSENFSINNYSGGFQVEVPVGDRFTLNYKGLIGGSDNRTLYAHAP